MPDVLLSERLSELKGLEDFATVVLQNVVKVCGSVLLRFWLGLGDHGFWALRSRGLVT